MRILHITAQKPNSTGSGVYMSGLIESLNKLGNKQAVIAGIDVKDDKNSFGEDINYYPVIYNTEKLPFSVMGMSDNMPYESTRYKDLTKSMVKKIKEEFLNVLNHAIDDFKPDIIICNHLYLITAFVREAVRNIKVIGICHGTCLRQLNNIDLEKDYIINNVRELDNILVLHEEQRKEVIRIFNVNTKKISIIGSGYDDKIFYNKNYKRSKKINLTYAGKICKSKGLEPLLRSMDKLDYDENHIVLNLAGSGSNIEEVNEIKSLADKCKYKVIFHGKLNHQELAELFNKSNIFILPSFYEGLPVVVLEALACGCNVIVSEINGLEDFMGDEINQSGNISYIKLPKMKSVGKPLKSELPLFEENISKSIKNFIDNVSEKAKNTNIKNKTWDGLALKVDKIIKNMV